MKLALAFVLVASLAHADDGVVSYRVKQGETIDLVAAEFYGDHARTSLFIVDENKWKTYKKLNPGEKIRVPITREITTAAGDSLPALAQKYLGDANRASFIAQYNNIAPTLIPASGVVLKLPLVVTHVAQTTESITAISNFYFGDAKQVDVIRTYNNLGDKGAVEKGDSVLIPVLNVRVHQERIPVPDADAIARRKEHTAANEAATAALPIARTAALQGDYAGVAKALSDVGQKLEYVDAPMMSEIGILLGKALVADGKPANAKAMFAQVIAREPQKQMSAYYESPTVIDAWRAANGKVAE
ncbi:MAG: LysM peptidoglycan-binding domain-containing protein [Kofleriaceae bacterium]